MYFIDKLETLITFHGYNWRSFSNAIGIPYTTVMSWRNVQTDNMKLKTARQISDFFNVSLDYWFTENLDEYKEYIPYIAKASEETIRNIRFMLGMPLKKSGEDSSSTEVV